MEYPKPPRQSTMQQLGPYLGIGMQLAAAMTAFGALGWWLDTKLDTTPWLLVAGVTLGAVGGMISFIRTALRSGRMQNSKGKMQKGEEESL